MSNCLGVCQILSIMIGLVIGCIVVGQDPPNPFVDDPTTEIHPLAPTQVERVLVPLPSGLISRPSFTHDPVVQDLPRKHVDAVGSGAKLPQAEYFFSSPAYFTVTTPDSLQSREETALVVYDGMQIRFQKNGEYQVNFTTSPPDRPATLYLQFLLRSTIEGVTRDEILFTLPPVRLNSKQYRIAGYTPSERDTMLPQQISHSGFSAGVSRCFHALCRIAQAECDCPADPHVADPMLSSLSHGQFQIVRTGTAKFGFGYQLD